MTGSGQQTGSNNLIAIPSNTPLFRVRGSGGGVLEMGGMGKGRWEEEGKGGREVGVGGGGLWEGYKKTIHNLGK